MEKEEYVQRRKLRLLPGALTKGQEVTLIQSYVYKESNSWMTSTNRTVFIRFCLYCCSKFHCFSNTPKSYYGKRYTVVDVKRSARSKNFEVLLSEKTQSGTYVHSIYIDETGIGRIYSSGTSTVHFLN